VQKVDWSPQVSKAISEAIKAVSAPKSALKDKSVYLFAASEDEGKVVHGCFVSEVSAELPSPHLHTTPRDEV